ncbi:hypothetical protein HUU40_02200 [candidate division KSB1 bacterium]|nr:hypothetical protein [candidate division KSB1 bacterium]
MSITRTTVIELLSDWQAGKIDEKGVHEKAEQLLEQLNWPEYTQEDHRSIVVEILMQLEILNHQLITRDDIPAMMAFLQTSSGQQLQGWKDWRAYWDSLDIKKRKETLRSNPYYST